MIIKGDGDNAGLLAATGGNPVVQLQNLSLFDFYNRTVGNLGVTTASADAQRESADAALSALQQQRASVSGVNLDEEAVQLLRYERAFQGAARFTSIVDRLISELLAIVR